MIVKYNFMERLGELRCSPYSRLGGVEREKNKSHSVVRGPVVGTRGIEDIGPEHP